MKNLFVYGALMYEEVWSRIVQGDFCKIKGQISGYRRLAVKNEEYPGLVVGDGIVQGYIWLGLDEGNLARLDIFEGEYYERTPAIAVDKEGNSMDVNVYSFRKEFLGLLENNDWNVKEFEKYGLKKFISRYVGFDQI